MVISPKFSSAALVLLFQPKNRYYMAILPKLSPAGLVPRFKPKNRYYTVIFPKLSSAALVPRFKPKNRYYMVILPKLSSAALVPLFQPKNSYHMVISPKLSSATHISLSLINFFNFEGQKGRSAQFGRVLTDIPVNFESVIITGRYCTNSDFSMAAFPSANSELPCKLCSIICTSPESSLS